jgi:hypothetical protein
MSDINLWAVLVGFLASGALGTLWYSRWLFLDSWKRAAGQEPARGTAVTAAKFISTIAAAAAFGWWAGPDPVIEEAVLDGLVVGVFFAAAGLELHYALEGRSITLWLIDGGYQVARFVLLGVVFGLVG